MDFRGQATYIPRYDHPPARDEDVGDLDFDILFAHGNDHHNHQGAPGVGQQQQYLHLQRENQPNGAQVPAAAAMVLQGNGNQWLGLCGNRGEDQANNDKEEQLIFDFDLGDDEAYGVGHQHHHHRLLALQPPRRGSPITSSQLRQEHIADMAAQVARQQRYVDNIREQLNFPAKADGGRQGVREALKRAEEALMTLREALREADRDGEEEVQGEGLEARRAEAGNHEDDNGNGAHDNYALAQPEKQGERGRGRRHRRWGVDPAARRETEQELAGMRESQMQMQWVGAAPDELRQVAEEVQRLEDMLSGRVPLKHLIFAITIRVRSRTPLPPKKKTPTPARLPLSSPPLSTLDPRLPPVGIARTDSIEVHDAEGPRYLALITLDNPHPDARAAERDILARARQAFARYEAAWFTVLEHALSCGALKQLSSGPRGAIWVVEEGRVDVLGAMLKASEGPEGVQSWECLGVGVGGAEGVVFCLHNPEEKKKRGKTKRKKEKKKEEEEEAREW